MADTMNTLLECEIALCQTRIGQSTHQLQGHMENNNLLYAGWELGRIKETSERLSSASSMLMRNIDEISWRQACDAEREKLNAVRDSDKEDG